MLSRSASEVCAVTMDAAYPSPFAAERLLMPVLMPVSALVGGPLPTAGLLLLGAGARPRASVLAAALFPAWADLPGLEGLARAGSRLRTGSARAIGLGHGHHRISG